MRKPEQRLHPQILRLMHEEPDASTPEEAILARARNRIKLAQSLGWEGPPFDIEQLASLLGMRVEYIDGLPFGQSGAIVKGSPIRVLIATSDPPVRQRYTIAHEIAHTLIPGTFGRSESVGWRYRLDAQSPVEVLCQIAASEFLMPTEAVRSLPSRRSMLESLMAIRNGFDVSHEAAARKLIAMTPRPAAGLLLRQMNKPSERTDELQHGLFGALEIRPAQRLRVVYAFSSLEGPFVPAHKSIPQTSRVYDLLNVDRGGVTQGMENWVECFGWKSTLVEAVRLTQLGSAFEALCLISASEA